MMDKNSGEAFCGCSPGLSMYFYAPTNKCYELYTRGPCAVGHIISFNYTILRPECKCQDNFNFYQEDGACYELNTPGPCKQMPNCKGTPCYMKGMDSLLTGCRCLPENSLTDTGMCYEPYTRGPCQFGEWFVFNKDGGGNCEEKKYCKRFDNWHWWSPHQRCYRQFTQGPCGTGSLFYLDPEKGGPGCHCRQDWEAYYWHKTGECFEQESRGPCKPGQYFAYNSTTRVTECNCFKNHVVDTDGTCTQLYTQGPCPIGQIVIASQISGELSCDCGSHLRNHYWSPTGQCYPLYVQGPCTRGEQFRLDPRTNSPACIVWGGANNNK